MQLGYIGGRKYNWNYVTVDCLKMYLILECKYQNLELQVSVISSE